MVTAPGAHALGLAHEAAHQLQDGVLIGSELRTDLLQQIQAHATLAIAEALQQLADAQRPAEPMVGTVEPVALDRDKLACEAAARIDEIGNAGTAGPWVHVAGGLGLDYAEHWPTLVAVEVVLNALKNARLAVSPEPVTRGCL